MRAALRRVRPREAVSVLGTIKVVVEEEFVSVSGALGRIRSSRLLQLRLISCYRIVKSHASLSQPDEVQPPAATCTRCAPAPKLNQYSY